ncbi:hypothetical protein HDU67_005571 [Dinochytrium kinnereticum]|nr:hypothetical protein HDU67_005571 [Dinochytrium kinnereticum]
MASQTPQSSSGPVGQGMDEADEMIQRQIREESKRLRQKAMVDARFGVGAYDRAQEKIKPHRCNGHMEDLIIGMTSIPFDVVHPFKLFWGCMFSKEGEEPSRLMKQSSEFVKETSTSHPFFSRQEPRPSASDAEKK